MTASPAASYSPRRRVMFSNCALRSGWCPIVFFFRAVRRPSLSFLNARRIVRRLAGVPSANSRRDSSRSDRLVHSTPARIGSPAVNSCNSYGGSLPGSAAQLFAAGALPLFSDAPSRRILCLLQLAEALTDGFRIARQDPRDVLDPAMPQLGRLDGCISTAILFRQPPEEPPHLPCDLCYIHFHAVLLAPESTP